MSFGVTFFGAMAICIRLLAGQQNAVDIAFWRSVLGTLFLLPFMLRGFNSNMFRTPKLPLFCLRAVLTYFAMIAFFFALANVNIVDTVALNGTIPLWTILFAAFLLPEKVGRRRIIATGVGFLGAMVILRPGFQDISIAMLLALGSAVLYAAAGITVKILARTEPATRIVFYMNFLLLVIAAGPAIYRWNIPSLEAVPLLLAVGIFGTLAHLCITRAVAVADASFCAPFDFWRLMLAALAGWLLFDEPGSLWTWVGGLIVFASAIYVTRREAIAARAVTPS
jgi:drug/metabolite transporter (DMT)-like permease